MLKIANKNVGEGSPCFIAAEIGMNHNGDLGLAEEMITSVAECGADAVKFQIFHAESFVTKDAMVYGEGRSGQPVTQIDMLKPYEFSLDQWERLKEFSEKKGLIFFASVLDDYSAELFASLEPPLFKIVTLDNMSNSRQNF